MRWFEMIAEVWIRFQWLNQHPYSCLANYNLCVALWDWNHASQQADGRDDRPDDDRRDGPRWLLPRLERLFSVTVQNPSDLFADRTLTLALGVQILAIQARMPRMLKKQKETLTIDIYFGKLVLWFTNWWHGMYWNRCCYWCWRTIIHIDIHSSKAKSYYIPNIDRGPYAACRRDFPAALSFDFELCIFPLLKSRRPNVANEDPESSEVSEVQLRFSDSEECISVIGLTLTIDLDCRDSMSTV